MTVEAHMWVASPVIVSFEMAWFCFILGYYSMVGRGCLDGGEDFLGEGGRLIRSYPKSKLYLPLSLLLSFFQPQYQHILERFQFLVSLALNLLF